MRILSHFCVNFGIFSLITSSNFRSCWQETSKFKVWSLVCPKYKISAVPTRVCFAETQASVLRSHIRISIVACDIFSLFEISRIVVWQFDSIMIFTFIFKFRSFIKILLTLGEKSPEQFFKPISIRSFGYIFLVLRLLLEPL